MFTTAVSMDSQEKGGGGGGVWITLWLDSFFFFSFRREGMFVLLMIKSTSSQITVEQIRAGLERLKAARSPLSFLHPGVLNRVFD